MVREYRRKYSKIGSGRPVKQRIGETVERDRHKQVLNNKICFLISFASDGDYTLR